jgi:hypothetical protein
MKQSLLYKTLPTKANITQRSEKKMKKNVFVNDIFSVAFGFVVIGFMTLTGCPNDTGKMSVTTPQEPSSFTSVADFGAWLSQQSANTAARAYTVKLNVNSLGGDVRTSGSVGYILSTYNDLPPSRTSTRYVILDLSGSALTSIDTQAFESCCGLTGVIIPSSVTEIKSSAFNRCYSLTSVTIPSSVAILGDWVFGNNDKLTSVTFKGTIPAADFSSMGSFFGDLRAKFYAANPTNGTPGTYTTTAPVGASSVWTKR